MDKFHGEDIASIAKKSARDLCTLAKINKRRRKTRDSRK